MQIERGIPIPEDHGVRRRRSQLPFARMEVGDSVLVPADSARRMLMAAATWKRRHPGWDYTTRKASDGTMRLWRTR